MTIRVVLVGCGNMGRAMLSGWLAAGRVAQEEVAVVEPGHENAEKARKLGVSVAAEPDSLGTDVRPELVVLAMKPQAVAEVVPAYRRFAETGSAFVSVAAGTSIAAFEAILGSDTAILRCMPNTPASIGRGMMVTVSNANVDAPTERFVSDLLSASGEVTRISDESLMDAVTAVSGSGPAYLFHFVECLTQAGEKAGLPTKVAALLARQTAFGAASLIVESGEEPGELRRQVTSPNGTTQAALDVLMGDDRMLRLMEEAVEAARARSVELGKA
ncbi:MAG: pyrroline-5-carboxylate reductase [Mesorhizobium sp.]|nr:pyrroline-5-carboxylate reductase [Mesorhizobium sp.]